jgi:NitT/TauT family transport system permease protein
VLALWEVGAAAGFLPVRYTSSPSRIVAAGIIEIQNPRFLGDLRTSLIEFSAGYALAVAAGIPAGLALGWYRRLSAFFEPLLNFLYATPRVALLPLIVVWLGIGIWSKIAIVFLGAWVTILVTTYLGVRTVDVRYTTVARSFGARHLKTFRSVIFPSTIPFMLAGMRLGIGRALIGIVVAELYSGAEGIGFMIKIASNNLQIDRMLFAVVILILFGLATNALIKAIHHRVAPWRIEAVAE